MNFLIAGFVNIGQDSVNELINLNNELLDRIAIG